MNKLDPPPGRNSATGHIRPKINFKVAKKFFGYCVVTNSKQNSFVHPRFKPTNDSSESTRKV